MLTIFGSGKGIYELDTYKYVVIPVRKNDVTPRQWQISNYVIGPRDWFRVVHARWVPWGVSNRCYKLTYVRYYMR
jgi:hypothetical protein